MSVPVARIHELLLRSARRAALVLSLRAGLAALAALLVALALVTVAANAGARSLALVALALGLFAAIGLAARRAWLARGLLAPRAQAAHIESLVPELRGGLATVVDRTARPTGSPGLLSRLAEQVGARVHTLRPADLWPLAPTWREGRFVLVAGALLGLAALRGPMGPIEAIWQLFSPASAQAAAAPVSQSGPRAMLGDITLRYLYPTYTRLEPLEVPNTSGEVHAPPGTLVEVRARTAQVWEAVALEVTGQERAPATLEEGRLVRASFTVAGEGVWRLDFGTLMSPDYRIVPEPDHAPLVAVSGPPRIRESLDTNLFLNTSVKDDYGITRLVAEVTVGGKAREVELLQPMDTPRALNELLPFTPKAWGLREGDVAKVRVGAWDNDAVSGSKVGWSTPFTLEVLGAGGSFQQQAELRAALLKALIPPLADFLTDPSPVGRVGSAVQLWADRAEERYDAFDLAAAGTQGLGKARFEGRLVENVNGPRRDLLAFARGLGAGELSDGDRATLVDLHAANVVALETAVWMLDSVVRAEAREELLELVKRLAEEAESLRAEIGELDKPLTLARLDRIVRLKAQVEDIARSLEQGGIRQFLESRGGELDGAIAATRRDVAQDDRVAAQRDMERVADLLAEMAGGVEEAEKRRGEGEDQLAKAMAELRSQLEDLAARQEELRDRVEAGRQKHGQSLDDGLAAWRQVERAAEEATRELDSEALDAMGDVRSVAPGVADARHDAQGLSDSVSARDVDRARQRAEDTLDSVSRARARLEGARRSGGIAPGEAASAASALDRAGRAAEKAARALDELAQAQSQASPELQDALRKLASEQSELAKEGREASENARSVGQQLPTDASGLREAADEGAEQAQRGSEAMQDGDALGAEGATGAAASSWRRALRELDQAEQDMREMQSQGGSGSGEGEGQSSGGEGEEEGGGRGVEGEGRDHEVAIPAPEEFDTPEAYRKALLEGMQGDVPEAYRAANRRYYEELVRQ